MAKILVEYTVPDGDTCHQCEHVKVHVENSLYEGPTPFVRCGVFDIALSSKLSKCKKCLSLMTLNNT